MHINIFSSIIHIETELIYLTSFGVEPNYLWNLPVVKILKNRYMLKEIIISFRKLWLLSLSQHSVSDIEIFWSALIFEPQHDKTNKMACASSEDSDQPGHSPSLIRVFAVRMKKTWALNYPLSAQRRLWSDWMDKPKTLQTGRMPRLIWVFAARSHFVGFVMLRLSYEEFAFINSPEPKAHRWAYSIGRHPSSVRCQYFQTTSPILSIFHI